jgi:MFS family permease
MVKPSTIITATLFLLCFISLPVLVVSFSTTRTITILHPKRHRRRLEGVHGRLFLNSIKSDDNVVEDVVLHEDVNKDYNDNSREVWGSFALLLFSQFFLFIGVGAVIPSIPLYGKELGLTGSANGIVISAPAVALLLCANTGGRLADRRGRKPAMIGGMALIAISDIGTATSNSLFTLAMARLGLGAGRAISESGERGMLADIANKLPGGVRGKVLAAQQAVVALGVAIGAPVGGIVVEQYGPRAAFLCVSAAAIITCALYTFLPETTTTMMTTNQQNQGSNKNGASIPNKFDKDDDQDNDNFGLWRELLQDDQWRGLSLAQAGASFGYAAKIASIPILAAGVFSNGAAGSGALLSAAALSGLVGAPLGGVVTDAVGAKQTAILGGIVSGIALILIPLSLSSSVLTQSPTLTFSLGNIDHMDGNSFWFSMAVLLWSMATAGQGPALTALAQEKATTGSEATSLALVKAAGDGTYIVAPFLMGLLADTVDEVPGVECLLAGTAILLGTISLAFLAKDETKDI